MNFNLTEIYNKKEWDTCIKKCLSFDFYHTFDYHNLSKSDDETPLLLKYEEGDIIIAVPLLVRHISGTNYKDLTSVYGYAGPISKGVTNNYDNTNFKKEFVNFLKANNFVSIFSRLNPFIDNQSKILFNLGTILPKGKIVNIDITKNLENQRRSYQKRLKTYINKSRRNSSVKKATTLEDLKTFIDIYYENMKRVNADDFYFFSELYFKNLVASKDFETEILLSIDNETNKTMSGCLFIISNGIAQYHLSGTKTEFLNKTPTKLLIDEMRVIASNKKLNFLNLGGGLGGSENDSLFNFKSSFSKDYKNFNIWNLIVNQEIYNDLVAKTKVIKDPEYFPLYRSIKISKHK